jgi:hypothetical protein
MLILIGTNYTHENLGKVADYCPMCGRVQPFYVRRVLSSQIIMVPLPGNVVGTHMQCRTCKGIWEFQSFRYSKLVPYREEIDLDDLVAVTNPALRDRGQPQSQGLEQTITVLALRNGVQEPCLPSSAPDTQVAELLEGIKPYENAGAPYDRLLAHLSKWPKLSTPERAVVAGKVARFLDARRTELLLIDVAKTYPRFPGVLWSLILFAMLQAPAILLMAVFPGSPLIRNPGDGPALLMLSACGGLFVCVFVWAFLSSWERKQWYKNMLIPRALYVGADFEMILDLMKESRALRQIKSDRIAGMRDYSSILEKVLKENRVPRQAGDYS